MPVPPLVLPVTTPADDLHSVTVTFTSVSKVCTVQNGLVYDRLRADHSTSKHRAPKRAGILALSMCSEHSGHTSVNATTNKHAVHIVPSTICLRLGRKTAVWLYGENLVSAHVHVLIRSQLTAAQSCPPNSSRGNVTYKYRAHEAYTYRAQYSRQRA